MASVHRLVQQFDGLSRRKVTFSGHGAWSPQDGFFRVPQGVRLFFYVDHGWSVSFSLGWDLDGGIGNRPMEICEAGQQVANYRLYPRTAGTPFYFHNNARGDRNFITTDNMAGITLEALLRDARCQNADCHWAACRAILTLQRTAGIPRILGVQR